MTQEPSGDLAAAVAADERRFGADDPRTLDGRVRLALAYREEERDEEAVAQFEHVVAARERLLGPDHADTAAARHELALSYLHVGFGGDDRLDDAVRTMTRAAEGRSAALGAAHPDTLASRTSLASLHRKAGRDDQAQELREGIVGDGEQLVAEYERRLGHDEPQTQFARVNLASAYDEVGRAPDARGPCWRRSPPTIGRSSGRPTDVPCTRRSGSPPSTPLAATIRRRPSRSPRASSTAPVPCSATITRKRAGCGPSS